MRARAEPLSLITLSLSHVLVVVLNVLSLSLLVCNTRTLKSSIPSDGRRKASVVSSYKATEEGLHTAIERALAAGFKPKEVARARRKVEEIADALSGVGEASD